MITSKILENSIQISDGLTQTSADGASLAFDKKYGIMFCAYMPGPQGHYGESRGRIALTYFPASQPTNSRTVDVIVEKDVYVPNIIGLGDGKVRVLYEKNSRFDGDHHIGYKDFDFLTGTLSEEKLVKLKKEDGTIAYLTGSEQFAYLKAHGYTGQTYWPTEQIAIGGHTIFRAEDGYCYGSITSLLAQPILYRSKDDMATVEFFAIFPELAQYEFDYKFLDGKIYAIYRTDRAENSISFSISSDGGKTWLPSIDFEESIQCRPRIIVYGGDILMSYHYFNDDTQNRPKIQQGRTSLRIVYGRDADRRVVADLYSKCGIVNACIIDVLGDVYFAYSTSELALEYQNGNPQVRGKDAIRYIKLGDLSRE